jgi:DNA-binding transcriptional ArsR family regulator
MTATRKTNTGPFKKLSAEDRKRRVLKWTKLPQKTSAAARIRELEAKRQGVSQYLEDLQYGIGMLQQLKSVGAVNGHGFPGVKAYANAHGSTTHEKDYKFRDGVLKVRRQGDLYSVDYIKGSSTVSVPIGKPSSFPDAARRAKAELKTKFTDDRKLPSTRKKDIKSRVLATVKSLWKEQKSDRLKIARVLKEFPTDISYTELDAALKSLHRERKLKRYVDKGSLGSNVWVAKPGAAKPRRKTIAGLIVSGKRVTLLDLAEQSGLPQSTVNRQAMELFKKGSIELFKEDNNKERAAMDKAGAVVMVAPNAPRHVVLKSASKLKKGAKKDPAWREHYISTSKTRNSPAALLRQAKSAALDTVPGLSTAAAARIAKAAVGKGDGGVSDAHIVAARLGALDEKSKPKQPARKRART